MMANYSELSSEINIDYRSDDCKQITSLLQDKFSSLLEENSMSAKQFEQLPLSDQFLTIESFQRRRRDQKHEALFKQNEKNDLTAFSKT